MSTFILIIHIIVSIFLIAVVLLQSGKGGAGSTFGGGESQTLLGTSGGTFMGKVTTAAAVVFMLTSLTLAYLASTSANSSVMRGVDTQPKIEEKADVVPEKEAPASDAPVPEKKPDQKD